jgi:hypothetical protein
MAPSRRLIFWLSSNERNHAAARVAHAAIILTYVDLGVGHAGAGAPHGDHGLGHSSINASQAASGAPHSVGRVIHRGIGVDHDRFSANCAEDRVNVSDVGVLRRAPFVRRAARPPTPRSRNPGLRKINRPFHRKSHPAVRFSV